MDTLNTLIKHSLLHEKFDKCSIEYLTDKACMDKLLLKFGITYLTLESVAIV